MASPSTLDRARGGVQAGLATPSAGLNDTLLLIGRIALAMMFVLAGATKLMSLAGTQAYIASKGLPAAGILAPLVGAFEVAAGLAVIAGFQTRLAAFLLAAFTLAASVLFHNFWAMEGAARTTNMLMFNKNIAVIGGFLLLAAAGAGRFSLDRR